MIGISSKIDVPGTLMSRHSNILTLLDSKHRLQIPQQLRTTLTSLTTCCPTTWSRQHWPQRVTANCHFMYPSTHPFIKYATTGSC